MPTNQVVIADENAIAFGASNPITVWASDVYLQHAYDVIQSTYGDTVTVKPKNLLKFGLNPGVGTSECTIMGFVGSEVAETYATANSIDSIVSGNDTNHQTMVVEGHTVSGSELTFVVQNVTLTGQTPALLPTPLFRATRLYNNDTSNLASSSIVYVYDSSATAVDTGVPQTAAGVHIIANAAENQSLKASTAFSNIDYGLITHVYADVNKQKAAQVDIRLKIREFGKVFRTQFVRTVASDSNGILDFPLIPYLIVPKNADVIITATASTTAVSVSGGFNTLIATVT